MVFYVLYLFVPSEFVFLFIFFLLPGVTAYGLESAVQSGHINAVPCVAGRGQLLGI